MAHSLLDDLSAARQRIADLERALVALLSDKPDSETGQYIHALHCNADRKQPVGARGECSCGIGRRIKTERTELERALRHAEQARDEAQAAASAEAERRRAAEAVLDNEREAIRHERVAVDAQIERLRQAEAALADHGPDGHNVTNAQYVALRAEVERLRAALSTIVNHEGEGLRHVVEIARAALRRSDE